MLYILSGKDDFSISRELENIKNGIGDSEMLATNTNVLDGKQVSSAELNMVCESAPFLSEKRLVIVYGLLGRFDAKAPSRSPKRKKKTDSPSTGHEAFGECIDSIPGSTILVLIEEELKGTNPLLKTVSGKATLKTYPLLSPAELRPWINKYVSQEKAKITPNAVNALIKLIGSNLWIMSNELNKLIAYAYGRQIEETDVKALVSYSQQTSIFTLVDAVMAFDIREAEALLQQLLQQGATATYILAMIYRQIRLVVRTREMKRLRLKESEIRQRLGVASDYVVRKTLEQAGRFSMPRIKQVYQQLLDTDFAIKTGKYPDDLALNILIAELCQRTPVASG